MQSYARFCAAQSTVFLEEIIRQFMIAKADPKSPVSTCQESRRRHPSLQKRGKRRGAPIRCAVKKIPWLPLGRKRRCIDQVMMTSKEASVFPRFHVVGDSLVPALHYYHRIHCSCEPALNFVDTSPVIDCSRYSAGRMIAKIDHIRKREPRGWTSLNRIWQCMGIRGDSFAYQSQWDTCRDF